MMRALVLLCNNQHTKFKCLHQFQRYDWGKFKKRVTWPGSHPVGSSLSSKAKHLMYSTCIQNLATVASAIPEIAGVEI